MLDDVHHQNRLITSNQLREMCGNVSAMMLWRWQNNAALNFPAQLRVNRRRYWREAEILAWLDARAEADA